MAVPDQFISPDQWTAIKSTVAVLNEAEVNNTEDLPGWFFELRDQLTKLLVSTTDPVEPFPVTEHFAYLLDMYVAGSATQDSVGDGSQLVVDWATQTLVSCAALDILPRQGGSKTIWLVVHAMEKEQNEQ